MSYETRQDMSRELTEISVNRKQLAGKIAENIMDNFTSKEIALIAQTLGVGNYYRLLELIKR